MALHRCAFCLEKSVVLAAAVATLSLKLCGLLKTKKKTTSGLLPRRAAGALMRADLDADKAGSLAVKASPTKIYYICSTDPNVSWSLLYGLGRNYTPAAFHQTK